MQLPMPCRCKRRDTLPLRRQLKPPPHTGAVASVTYARIPTVPAGSVATVYTAVDNVVSLLNADILKRPMSLTVSSFEGMELAV